MKKSELVDSLARRHDLSERDVAARALQAVFEIIGQALARGHRVELRGFGTFSIKIRGPRIARNPRQGGNVEVGRRQVVYFRSSKKLRELLNGTRYPR